MELVGRSIAVPPQAAIVKVMARIVEALYLAVIPHKLCRLAELVAEFMKDEETPDVLCGMQSRKLRRRMHESAPGVDVDRDVLSHPRRRNGSCAQILGEVAGLVDGLDSLIVEEAPAFLAGLDSCLGSRDRLGDQRVLGNRS